MDNTGGGGGVSTVTLLLKDSVPTDAVTVYEPEEPLPVFNVVLACPLLSVVVLVGLSDTVPSAGLTLNVTVSPGASIPSSWTSRENVVLSPGVRGQIVLNINAKRPDGGGGVLTVAVPLVDLEPLDAVIVYEPEALFPSISVVEARPLLPVVVLAVPSDALPSPDVILNVTVFPEAALPSS